MSITNLIHKIKSNTYLDKTTIVYLFVIIGVGIGSFGLGRISVDNGLDINMNELDISTAKALYQEDSISDDNVLGVQPSSLEKRYVASKNGKMYYSIGCGGASRIKPENEVWFSSKEDAEKSGYALSTTCK